MKRYPILPVTVYHSRHYCLFFVFLIVFVQFIIYTYRNAQAVDVPKLKAFINQFLESDSDSSRKILRQMLTHYSIPHIVKQFWKTSKNDEIVLAEKFYPILSMKRQIRPVKTIGIFYMRFYEGGIERVISLQIPIYLQLGYKVVLFTDEIDRSAEYPLDDRVIRVLLPSEYNKHRADILFSSLVRHKVDLMIYHAHLIRNLLFDMILCKLTGILFMIERHGTMFNCALENDSRLAIYPHLYRLANKVLTPSHMEEAYLQLMGVDAQYFPNPIQFPSVTPEYSQNEGIILWIGRLASVDKNYLAALEIMKEVVVTHPDAQMVMVGPEFDSDSGHIVRRFIRSNHLEHNLRWIGSTANVTEWYRKAKIHLVTSSYESFCMVILESKAFAVPLVMYSIPYLELIKSGKGMISVPQYDIKKAADAIRLLLDNDTLCNTLSEEAFESLQPFRDFNQTSSWAILLKELQNPRMQRAECVSKAEIQMMFDTLLVQYSDYRRYRQNNGKEPGIPTTLLQTLLNGTIATHLC